MKSRILHLKENLIANRLVYFFVSWPSRFVRLFYHLFMPFKLGQFHVISWTLLDYLKNIGYWVLALILLVIDLFAIPELYENVMFLIKRSSRRLNKNERKVARLIFGNQLNFELVRIDEASRVGSRKWGIIYVSFHTINSWGKIPMHILIHELVHIWQYENFGSAYISHALKAQNSKAGYNYGGEAVLSEKKSLKLSIAFNYEQQAEIIEDYYRMVMGMPLQWSRESEEVNELLRLRVTEINPDFSILDT